MKQHRKKMAAPIVVTVLLILYYGIYFAYLLTMVEGVAAFLLGLVPLVFSAVLVYVCVERIKEIKGGEEDDIGQY